MFSFDPKHKKFLKQPKNKLKLKERFNTLKIAMDEIDGNYKCPYCNKKLKLSDLKWKQSHFLKLKEGQGLGLNLVFYVL